jgi:CheY-like chemotaxis protein
MNAILGWLKLMRMGRLTAEQSEKAIDTVERNALLQNQLINDLLDISRIIAGKLELQREPVLIREIVEAAVNSVRLAADAKEIQVACHLEAVGPLHYDTTRLQQVFVNILSNAVKFTPVGGRIHISGKHRGDWYDVAVTDTGEGISAELLPVLFERFSQADGSTTRKHGGLGLGLAIVRHLVELHGGRVKAESEGPGHGATITVSLSLITDPAILRAVPVESQGGVVLPQSLQVLKGTRVLVTDDEASARDLMSQVLQAHGAVVKTASNSAEAFAMWSEWKPALVVLDIGMPVEDGYTLLERLRAHPFRTGPAVPAIAVTGYAQEADRDRALAAGFQAHIAKPINVERVVGIIAQLTSSRPGVDS